MSISELLNDIHKIYQLKTHINPKRIIGLVGVTGETPNRYENLYKKDFTTNALIIYNENDGQWKSNSTTSGGGNAIMRPFRTDINNPKIENDSVAVFGIPTQDDTGKFNTVEEYIKQNKEHCECIVASVGVIDLFLEKNPQIMTIYWCCDENGLLGSGIFKVSQIQKIFITALLYQMVQLHDFAWTYSIEPQTGESLTCDSVRTKKHFDNISLFPRPFNPICTIASGTLVRKYGNVTFQLIENIENLKEEMKTKLKKAEKTFWRAILEQNAGKRS